MKTHTGAKSAVQIFFRLHSTSSRGESLIYFRPFPEVFKRTCIEGIRKGQSCYAIRNKIRITLEKQSVLVGIQGTRKCDENRTEWSSPYSYRTLPARGPVTLAKRGASLMPERTAGNSVGPTSYSRLLQRIGHR